jgi:integrase
MARHPGVPKACLHRASGQAVVRLGGKDFYLGRWKSPETQVAYHRKIAEWLAAGPYTVGADLRPQTVADLAEAYYGYALRYYQRDGRPTSEALTVKSAIRRVVVLYGETLVADFGPLKLKAVRELMCGETFQTTGLPLSRHTINQHVSRVRRMFRWAAENELIDGEVYHRLLAVRGLTYGRGGRETPRRRPVARVNVEAALPWLSPQVRAMVELQWATGMRPGEAAIMRTADIDQTGPVWFYTPAHHKTEHHGHDRRVALGPRAQEVLRAWLRPEDPGVWLFQPAEAEGQRWAALRDARIAAGGGSGGSRKPHSRRPRRPPGQRYTADSYRRAIERACQQASIVRWTPHQIRHSFATRVRAAFGLDAARAALGHSDADVTLDYAEIDSGRAAEVAAQLG